VPSKLAHRSRVISNKEKYYPVRYGNNDAPGNNDALNSFFKKYLVHNLTLEAPVHY
jgi:hypothetical protein